ncbi:MAG: cytochrome P450 [Bacteriovoracia bacterium]
MANPNRDNSFSRAFIFVKLGHIPGPRGRAFFSYVRGFQQDILGYFTKVYEDFGHIASFSWPMNSVIIYSPEFVKAVLIDQASSFEKGNQIGELKAVVGNGLATNNDEPSWRRNRSIISREFGSKAFESSSSKMVQIIEESINLIEPGVCGVSSLIKKITFDVATNIFLGLDANSSESTCVEEAVSFTSEITYQRIFEFLPLPYWVPTQTNRRFNRHYRDLEAIVGKILKAPKDSDAPQGGVLRRLLSAKDPDSGKGMSVTEIRDEILTIMIAGHDTSSHTLIWTLGLIAQHPDVQEKIYQEILDADHLDVSRATQGTPFLQNVLFESMRLYPAFPVLSRKAKSEVYLGEHRIPPQTNVVIPIYVIQRSEEFWESPLQFLPKRFENRDALNSFSFLPFSKGKRRCVGEIFAMTEMTVILMMLLKKFKVSLVESCLPDPIANVTLKPEVDIVLRFEMRA